MREREEITELRCDEQSREAGQGFGVGRMNVNGALESLPRTAGLHMREKNVHEFAGFIADEGCTENEIGFCVDDQAIETIGFVPLDRPRDAIEFKRDAAHLMPRAARQRSFA